MKSWQEDLLTLTDDAPTERAAFDRIAGAVAALGFEYCAYGMRVPLPVSRPTVVMLNSYPSAWQARYSREGYLHVDPVVLHGRQSQSPLVWSDAVFASTPRLWEEARQAGLCVGWSQSSLYARGVGSMLTVSRSAEPLSEIELTAKDTKLRWLVSVAHMSLSRLVAVKGTPRQPSLTDREVEVLKWTADGKTVGEISDLLDLSENTVKFHVKNAVEKLGTPNKTAAVVRAVMSGLLYG